MTELFWREKPGGDVGVDEYQGKDRGRKVNVLRALLYPFRQPFPALPHSPPSLSPWLTSFPASTFPMHSRYLIIFRKLLNAGGPQ